MSTQLYILNILISVMHTFSPKEATWDSIPSPHFGRVIIVIIISIIIIDIIIGYIIGPPMHPQPAVPDI